jgi:hypothetical protein
MPMIMFKGDDGQLHRLEIYSPSTIQWSTGLPFGDWVYMLDYEPISREEALELAAKAAVNK